MVAADGTLVMQTTAQLTAYDNFGPNCKFDHGSPVAGRCLELYRYSPGEGMSCVSCNPTGAAPVGKAITTFDDPAARGVDNAKTPNFPRSVSADGSRVFFETPDKLIAADTNGDNGCDPGHDLGSVGLFPCVDVYEWEAEGSGSCDSDTQNGGCLYLLSSGASSDPSHLVDASASGDDVFIRTTDRLVPQDLSDDYDVYDVRVDGGLASQHPAEAPPCGSADQCHGQGTTPPSSNGAGSGVFKGDGNPPPPTCRGDKVKRGNRCVARHHKRKHHKKRHHKAKKHHQRSHRRAGADRGGSK